MCSPLPVPANVDVIGDLYQAQYSCHVGYNLSAGDNLRNCTTGDVWSGTAPVCTRKYHVIGSYGNM